MIQVDDCKLPESSEVYNYSVNDRVRKYIRKLINLMVEKDNKVNKPRPRESNVIGQTRRRVNRVDNRDHVKTM